MDEYRSGMTAARKRSRKPEKCAYCGDQNVYARGLCRNRYGRQLRNGTPEYTRVYNLDNGANLDGKPDRPWYIRLRNDVLASDTEPVPDDIESGALFAMDALSDAEKQVIFLRYRDGKTLIEAGRARGVTRERIRQIEIRALRKLGEPSRKIYMELGYSTAEAVIRQNEQARKDAEARRLEALRRKYEAVEWNEAHGVGIEVLGLGRRSVNCLHRAGIATLDALAAFLGTPADYGKLLTIWKLGQKSAEEIKIAVERFFSGAEATA